MRLLHTESYTLKSFIGVEIPEYAILSHTWEDDEMLFDDIQVLSPKTRRKKGFAKIKNFCRLAAQDGYEWVWIDCCCIDKSSSAELSEAINSMFRWYQDSTVCFVYMSDVQKDTREGLRAPDQWQQWRTSYETSRWFSRGWTLQELIAPRFVYFYDSTWVRFASKASIAPQISEITRINTHVLLIKDAYKLYPCAVRMSWASMRTTTRIEDRAYSLLGIFNMNMPLLYGEGEKAFMRLQEEILKNLGDYSILAWNERNYEWTGKSPRNLMAQSPDDFWRRPKATNNILDYTKLLDVSATTQIHRDLRGPAMMEAIGLICTLPVFEIVTNADAFQSYWGVTHLAFLFCAVLPSRDLVCLTLHCDKSTDAGNEHKSMYFSVVRPGILLIPESRLLERHKQLIGAQLYIKNLNRAAQEHDVSKLTARVFIESRTSLNYNIIKDFKVSFQDHFIHPIVLELEHKGRGFYFIFWVGRDRIVLSKLHLRHLDQDVNSTWLHRDLGEQLRSQGSGISASQVQLLQLSENSWCRAESQQCPRGWVDKMESRYPQCISSGHIKASSAALYSVDITVSDSDERPIIVRRLHGISFRFRHNT